jgi:biopolymer transport protein ExbD
MASKGPEMDLSSFMDIMTCILGILILIILLTGIDASQITVLVSTPKELTGDDKSPVFFECRNKSLFHISLDEIKQVVDNKTEEIRQRVEGDENEFLKQAATTQIEIAGQRLDYTFALMGRYVLFPIADATGYQFERYLREKDDMWYGSRLATVDPQTQFICFLVRPDSFKIFQQARALAWLRGIDVSVELQEDRNPIMIGPGGDRIYAQ